MVAVSTMGNIQAMMGRIQNTRSAADTLALQMSTQQKAQTLSGYGTEAPKLLNLQQTFDNRRSYISAIDSVAPYVGAYDTALGSLLDTAQKLRNSIAGLEPGTDPLPSEFATLVDGLSVQTSTALNDRIGDRFIFAGSRYSSPPVKGLETLPALPTPPAALTVVGQPPAGGPYDLPPYDVDEGTPEAGPKGWDQASITIADRERLTYGVTSNDPAIQRLVHALRGAAAATTATNPDRDAFLANATQDLDLAIEGLRTLKNSNSLNQVRLADMRKDHKEILTATEGLIGDVTNIDLAEVSAKITAAQNTLQASYKVTASMMSLSLLDYLR